MLDAVHDLPKDVDLVPAALISKPISWFEDHGVSFIEDTDELDAYKFAAFRSPTVGWFALMRYANSNPQSTTLMLDRRVNLRTEFVPVVTQVANALRLHPSAFRWREADEAEPPRDVG